jgi:molecular chaperone DnaK (HSP70)
MSDESNGVATPDAPEHYAIGISFGNSNSSIAHISGEGKVEVIANEEGDRQIPSVLSYVDGEEYHGTQAKAQLVRNSANTIAYFRDYLGKNYKSIDPTPCRASAHPIESGSTVAFSVRDTEDESPNNVTISEVTTRHIRRLRKSASDYSGKTVTSAVVAVPTDCTEEQKGAFSKAAEAAQVEILQFIPEPIAAVLAYDSRSTDSVHDKIIVVADLGGTRSDVAIVASRGGMYTILATAHDYELGGAQLDQILVDHFAKEFIKKHKIDPRVDARSLAKLKLESEAVKKALSQSTSATFSVESLADGIDFRATANRTRYELLAGKVFTNFTRLIEVALRKADMDLLDIDEVILSGGSSHTPRIASNIRSLFPESTPVLAPSTSATAINPSELAARGAAIQASLIQEFEKEDIDQSTHEMVTVTPHLLNAIGVQINSGANKGTFALVVPQDTPVPVRRIKQILAPAGDVAITVCEGEREIKVTKSEIKAKTNGANKGGDDDSDSEADDDDEEDEDEDVREKAWKVKKPLAEFAFRGLKKGAKIEVMVNVGTDLGLSVTAREVGGKGGVRGELRAPEVVENGTA